MRGFKDIAKKAYDRSFSRRQEPSGKPWPPISRTTFRLGKPAGSPPLVQTGNMRRSLKMEVIERAGGPQLIVQNTSRLAAIHEFGKKNNVLPFGIRAPIPARRFMGFSDGDIARSEKMAARWLDRYVDRPHRLTRARRTPKRIL